MFVKAQITAQCGRSRPVMLSASEASSPADALSGVLRNRWPGSRDAQSLAVRAPDGRYRKWNLSERLYSTPA